MPGETTHCHLFFFSSRRRHTRLQGDWSSDVCSSDLAHVVTENFRPGTLERWNLGWSELARLRPSLVMVRISAFGQTGPNRERPGFGRIAAAVGGLAYLGGYADRAPVSPGTPTVPDYLAGVFGAVGALVALRHAERTGE